jgi:predicted patatin/cPLA2 family phospholipase
MDPKFVVSWPDSTALYADQYSALASALEPHHDQYRKIQAEINRLQEQLVIIKLAALSELQRRQAELSIDGGVAVAVC